MNCMTRSSKRLTQHISVFLIVLSLMMIQACATVNSDWKATEKYNTIQSYQEFITKHPQSKQAADAKKKIDKLTWQDTEKENSEAAYKRYLKEFPQGLHIATAQEKLEVIAWNKAQELDSVKGYRGFIKNLANSQHIADAERRLKELLEDSLVSDKEMHIVIGKINVLIAPFTIMDLYEEYTKPPSLKDSNALMKTSSSSNYAKGEASTLVIFNDTRISVKAKLKPNSNPLTSTVVTVMSGSFVSVNHVLGKIRLSELSDGLKESNKKMVVWLENPSPNKNQDLSFEEVSIYTSDETLKGGYQKIGDSWYKIN